MLWTMMLIVTGLRVLKYEIPFLSKVKYLDVIFDQKLRRNSHIQKSHKKPQLHWVGIEDCAGRIGDQNTKISLWLQTRVIRPMIAYRAIIVGVITDENKVIRKLKGY